MMQIAYMAFYFGWGRIRERIFIGGGSVGLIAGGLFPYFHFKQNFQILKIG